MFAGLKGAVPLLLGSFILSEHIADAERLYGMVVIVVVLSVVVPGQPGADRGSPPEACPCARWSRSRGRSACGCGDEPNGVHRLTVARGSAADGIEDLRPHGAARGCVGQLRRTSAASWCRSARRRCWRQPTRRWCSATPAWARSCVRCSRAPRPRSSPATTRSISRWRRRLGGWDPLEGSIPSRRSRHHGLATATSAQTRNRRSRRCGGRDLRTEDSRTRRTSRAHELVRRPAAWMYPH